MPVALKIKRQQSHQVSVPVRRGLASPDLADALALTFAYPVSAHDHRWQLTGKPRHQYQYDPFQQAWSGRL